MTDLTYESFSDLLRMQVAGFDRIYDEHLRDYDQALPQVLVGELVRFLVQEVRSSGTATAAVVSALDLLERGMASKDPRLQELVAVSFLENLDPSDEEFAVIKQLFGPHLEQQWQQQA
jgi:hypothetical protein